MVNNAFPFAGLPGAFKHSCLEQDLLAAGHDQCSNCCLDDHDHCIKPGLEPVPCQAGLASVSCQAQHLLSEHA